jgi:dihydroxyacetone kinase phosphotransfer subunit
MAEPVGIVLVSHSERLAAGLRDLLEQFVGGRVPVEAAGGTAQGGIGTSDERVRAAIDRAQRGSGVAVLADLGSAVLTVLDVLAERTGDERASGDVVLADAPLVEGAVAAAVTAGAGAGLPEVVASAEQARGVPKIP